MVNDAPHSSQSAPLRYLPAARWIATYQARWLAPDIVAGITLAAYAIPVSLAYAGLAGLPPQVGIYGYLLGGLGYALLGSSRHLAIGPTSAISLMIAGAVGAMAGGDAERYGQIASLAGFTVALLCLLAWLLRLSMLVRLISDSILVGFKAGAGLTIMMTQIPGLLGVPGGGHNFLERAVLLAGQLDQIDYIVLALGLVAILLLVFGRAVVARAAGRACRRCLVDHCCDAARAASARSAHDGRNPARPAFIRLPTVAAAGRGGDCSSCRRVPPPCLYRKRFGRSRFRNKAWIYPGSAAGVSRNWGGQPGDGAGSRLSSGRRFVAVRGERKGGRAHSALPGGCLGYARTLPAFLYGSAGKSSKGSARRHRADGGIWPA